MTDQTEAPAEDQPGQSPESESSKAPEKQAATVPDQGETDPLGRVLAGMVAELPEAARALVPNLPTVEKMAWIQAAKASGVFAAKAVPETDSSKPTVTPSERDFSNMPAHARIAAGYSR